MKQIKDLLKTGTNRYTKIRQWARRWVTSNNIPKKCQWCGWDRYTEVCHIKSISSFPIDTDLSVVNDKTNLLILCPNCHWLHDHANEKDRSICECGNRKWKGSNHCRKCSHKLIPHNRKVVRPSKEILEKLVDEIPLRQLGHKFGVSGNAVKKWCKSYGIELGNRIGYWQKKRCKALTKIESKH